MNALPETVNITFRRTGAGLLMVEQDIATGPANHLEPGYRVQLFNLFANRNLRQINANLRLTGTLPGSQTDLSSESARENSAPGHDVPVTNNYGYVDPNGNFFGVRIGAGDLYVINGLNN
jgi:hypothetical protein